MRSVCPTQFMIKYFIISLLVFVMGILSWLQLNRFYSSIAYNSLMNPIFIYTPIYLIFFIMLRIGAYTSFSPRYPLP